MVQSVLHTVPRSRRRWPVIFFLVRKTKILICNLDYVLIYFTAYIEYFLKFQVRLLVTRLKESCDTGESVVSTLQITCLLQQQQINTVPAFCGLLRNFRVTRLARTTPYISRTHKINTDVLWRRWPCNVFWPTTELTGSLHRSRVSSQLERK